MILSGFLVFINEHEILIIDIVLVTVNTIVRSLPSSLISIDFFVLPKACSLKHNPC